MKYLVLLGVLISVLSAWAQDVIEDCGQWLEWTVQAIQAEDNWTFTFTNSKTGHQAAYVFGKTILAHRIIIMNEQRLYLVVDHSGGESGGFYNINILRANGDVVEKISLDDLSGYAGYDITDVNGDNDSELVVDTVCCSGLSIKLKEYQQEVTLTPGYHTGIIGGYKEIYLLDGGELKNVTFDKPYASYLRSLCASTEAELGNRRLASLHATDGDSEVKIILEILQYYRYMSRLGKQEAAMARIKEAGITVILPANDKEIRYDLSEIIRENSEKILAQ